MKDTMPSSTEQLHFDAEVIVVGAGPVGLTTGCALRHHGVDCLVLEQSTEPKPNSRANNLWARPQELLASIGLRDPLARQSYKIRQVNALINGQPTTPIQIDKVASPFPEVLYSGQDVIEATLAKTLEERGGTLMRGCKVTNVTTTDAGVTVTFIRGDGEETQLRSRYLVAADGSKSVVRAAIGLDFEFSRFEGRMNRQGDARLTWRRSLEPDQIWLFYYHHGLAGVLPVWGGYHRLFFLQDDAGVPDRDPTLEELQALGREVMGDETLTLSDPIWLTHSRFQYGVAKSFVRGRVFLAGDAGHLSLPIGGQGMNAGLHDAVGIAWRIAMTLKGQAAPAILDSYDGERQGEHARLSDQQAKGFRHSVYRGPVTDLVLDIGARAYPNIGSLLQGTGDLQQTSVHYPKSMLNEDHLTGLGHLRHSHGPKAGDRAPDAEVTHEGVTTTLHPFIYNPDGHTTGWSLLAFDGRSPEAGALLMKGLKVVAGWPWIRPRLVLSGPLVACEAPILSDLDGKAHSAYGLEGTPALVLIRPDGHIAFQGPADHADLLSSYCKVRFGPPMALSS